MFSKLWVINYFSLHIFICQILSGLVPAFLLFLNIDLGKASKLFTQNFKEPKLVRIRYQHIWNVNTCFFCLVSCDLESWFLGVIFSIPFFKCFQGGYCHWDFLNQLNSQVENMWKSQVVCLFIQGLSLLWETYLRKLLCVFFLHIRLMFSHQFIDWEEDAASAISILIEQNGVWVCDVGDCMRLLPSLYTKSG